MLIPLFPRVELRIYSFSPHCSHFRAAQSYAPGSIQTVEVWRRCCLFTSPSPYRCHRGLRGIPLLIAFLQNMELGCLPKVDVVCSSPFVWGRAPFYYPHGYAPLPQRYGFSFSGMNQDRCLLKSDSLFATTNAALSDSGIIPEHKAYRKDWDHWRGPKASPLGEDKVANQATAIGIET